jgi:hypothetical protein
MRLGDADRCFGLSSAAKDRFHWNPADADLTDARDWRTGDSGSPNCQRQLKRTPCGTQVPVLVATLLLHDGVCIWDDASGGGSWQSRTRTGS